MPEIPLKQLFECHGHALMDGVDFHAARERHKNGVDEDAVRKALEALQNAGVSYFRDGGDALGVSLRARELAGGYGIEYVSPAFAIHRRGRYGGIVGRAYESPEEYCALLDEAEREGCDFIKIMFSGIISFKRYGELSCPSLPGEEIRFLIDEAHRRGFAVMSHTNGAEAVLAAAEAGVDSIEHGYFSDERCLAAMERAGCIWVPTVAPTEAFCGRGDEGFDEAAARETLEKQMEAVRRALDMGVQVAPGSDSGAVGVPHGAGIREEYRLLREAAGRNIDPELQEAAELLRRRFRRR